MLTWNVDDFEKLGMDVETYALANLLGFLAIAWPGERLLDERDCDERPNQPRT